MTQNCGRTKIRMVGLVLAGQVILWKAGTNEVLGELGLLIQDKLNKAQIKVPYSSFLDYEAEVLS